MKNQKGFSLIELLIVVVIIGIIAAIAIPNLLAARRSANEGSAIASLRTIHGAEMTYQATAGGGEFAGDLGDLQTAGLVDSALASGVKSGYAFAGSATASSSTAPASFYYTGTPSAVGGVSGTGTRKFAINTPGVIYFEKDITDTTAMADPGDGTGLTPLNN